MTKGWSEFEDCQDATIVSLGDCAAEYKEGQDAPGQGVRLIGSVVPSSFRRVADEGDGDGGQAGDQQEDGHPFDGARLHMAQGPTETMVLGIAKGSLDLHAHRMESDVGVCIVTFQGRRQQPWIAAPSPRIGRAARQASERRQARSGMIALVGVRIGGLALTHDRSLF